MAGKESLEKERTDLLVEREALTEEIQAEQAILKVRSATLQQKGERLNELHAQIKILGKMIKEVTGAFS
jgi:hypothetical protein